MTLVAAQAGAGKTVLLASWVAAGRLPGPVAWVTLDSDDGDPRRFWAHVLAALRQSGTPKRVLETLPAQLPSADGAFQHLLEHGFGRLPEPVVLVLDDFHMISTPPVLDALQTMLRHTAPRLRLIISTRVDPNLPQLPRLRLNGELVELRTADLAFTADEAAELLDGHGVALSGTELALLKARTEGWAAGLRLAALWLQDRPDPTWAVTAFAGTDRTVADYLVAEIMDQQSPAMRDFLLRTCVVDQISGSLANALTGGTDGDQALVSLERANAFIGAVGPDRLWYRYHPLFAELLRFELRRRAPEEPARLHQRAAHWHAAHGSPVDAVRHALDAQDWAYSVDLLTQHGVGWVLQGETRAVRQAAERLPPDVVHGSPELGLLVAFERLESLHHAAVRRYLEHAQHQQVLVPEHRRDHFTVLMSLLELISARRSGEFERVMAVGREILSLQITTGALISGMTEDEAIRSVALLNLGAAELWSGNLDSAEGHLGQAADLAEHAGLGLLQLDGLSLLALLHVARGRLHAAHRTGRAATHLASTHGWSGHHHAGGAHLALASVSLDWDDLDAANRHIAAALISCATAPWRPVMLGVAIVRAWLCQARGDPAVGHAVLEATRQELTGWNPSPPSWMRDWVTVTEAELHTIAGDTDSAEAMLHSLVADNAGHRATSTPLAVASARLQLARGDAAGAVQTLAPSLDGSIATGSPRPLIAAWTLNAVAARQLGDDDVASQWLERALALAEPEGFRQVFVDGGPVVRELMGSHLERATSHRSFLGSLLSHTPTEDPVVAGPVESLSDRELVVLRYLPSRLSAAEIADELHLSVHTVKSHLRNLYRKLQASNRREAVDRARDLHLL